MGKIITLSDLKGIKVKQRQKPAPKIETPRYSKDGQRAMVQVKDMMSGEVDPNEWMVVGEMRGTNPVTYVCRRKTMREKIQEGITEEFKFRI